jgi:hypothetical protein
MALGNCTDCWINHRKAQLASLEVDDEPLCVPCARKRGVTEEEIDAQVPKPAPAIPAYAVALDDEDVELVAPAATPVAVAVKTKRTASEPMTTNA